MSAPNQQLDRSAALAARDSRVLWHPSTQMKDHETLPPIPIKCGEGVWLEDFGGRRHLDAPAQGVLLRPIGDVVYFMPPYTGSEAEIDLMVRVAAEGIDLATCD